MPTEAVEAFRAGTEDANGQVAERHVSDGVGVPCRHCLGNVAEGDPYLILAFRPFPALQPYAEVGPIFLHADACERYQAGADTPPSFLEAEQFLVKGYGGDDRILYGTGQLVPSGSLAGAAHALLDRSDVAYLHVRSAKNNCYRCRIERA
ncbi:MAG: DUF1203 domain-containing protein [Methyloligellaceae bacterium]